jgi:hypothetical protein
MIVGIIRLIRIERHSMGDDVSMTMRKCMGHDRPLGRMDASVESDWNQLWVYSSGELLCSVGI